MRQSHPLSEAWKRFWFSPTDPKLLGMVRILAGLMLLYTHAVWGLELEAFFGRNGFQSAELVRSLQKNQFVFSFWWSVPESLLHVVHWLSLFVLLLFTLGLFTQITSVLTCVIVMSYANRAPAALFGLDQINMMLALYLTIGGAGQSYSLDRIFVRYRRIRRAVEEGSDRIDLSHAPSVRANFGLRLIQVHMCVIYFFAAVSKLQGTAWWNGEAMWLAFSNLEYQSTDMTWLARFPWVINLITHVTIFWELSFSALVWVPILRPYVLVLAVLLHVGIGATLGMWTFGLVMLIGCATFLPPDVPTKVLSLFKPRELPAVRVVRFDPNCIGCRREAIFVKLFDVFDRVRLVEANASTEEQVGEEERESKLRFRPSWRHSHHNESETKSVEPPVVAAEPASEPEIAVTEMPESGPMVVVVRRKSRLNSPLGGYLMKRGFRVRATQDVDQGVAMSREQSTDCMLLFGKRFSIDELVGFQNKVAEIDEEITTVILLSPTQGELLSQLRVNSVERVLVEPVLLHDVRTEIESALASRNKGRRDIDEDSQPWTPRIVPSA